MMTSRLSLPFDEPDSTGLVLIADDDPRQARNIKQYLERHGLPAETAPNGFAAINAVKRLRPAIVLLDIRMPGLSGIEVGRHLLRRRPRPKVILISGFADSVADAGAAALDVFAVIEKPIPLEALAGVVRRALASAEA